MLLRTEYYYVPAPLIFVCVPQNSKPSKNKNSPPSEKEAQEALLAQEMKKLQEIQNQEIRRTRAIDDLKISLRDGSMALLDGKFKFAINLYEKCFTLIQQFTAVVRVHLYRLLSCFISFGRVGARLLIRFCRIGLDSDEDSYSNTYNTR